MKTKLVTTLIAAPLLALSSLASASEPVQLEAAQMDTVTAGVFGAGGTATATAIGAVAAATFTSASGTVGVIATIPVVPFALYYVGSLSSAQSRSSSL